MQIGITDTLSFVCYGFYPLDYLIKLFFGGLDASIFQRFLNSVLTSVLTKYYTPFMSYHLRRHDTRFECVGFGEYSMCMDA